MRNFVVALLIGFIISGCAAGFNHSQLNRYLETGGCNQAVSYIEQGRKSYGKNGELLFLLDSAMVLFQCGDFEGAQSRFREAEYLAEKLWTESITRNIASFAVSDNVLKYQGEDYERVLIHLISAIGFLRAGQLDEAMVECRRLDSLLSLYNTKYEEKNVYKEDAFARYLSGMLHEADSELDDAFIDYYKAVRVYKDYADAYGLSAPAILEEDLLRIAQAVGRLDEARSVVPGSENRSWLKRADTRAMGKVVYIQFSGYAPWKIQDRIVLPTRGGPVTVAFPRMVTVPPACRTGRLILTSTEESIEMQTFLAEDINGIAAKNLDDRKGRVIAKTMARAVTKQVIISGLANQGDEEAAVALRVLLNMMNLFIEHADTRSWRLLPGEIHVSRLYVPEGEYQVAVSLCDRGVRNLEKIRIAAGDTSFLFHDARYPCPTGDCRQ